MVRMIGSELRAIRKQMGLTQHELSERLGVTRKTLIGWEATQSDIDKGVSLRVREIAGQVRLVERKFWVEQFAQTYAVIGRRILGHGMQINGATILYGTFNRRDHAYRWCTALTETADTRVTRKLHRERMAQYGSNVTDN